MKLNKYDLYMCVKQLPPLLKKLVMECNGLIIAGGFIRGTIKNEEKSDIDLFGPDQPSLYNYAKKYQQALADKANTLVDNIEMFKTKNAYTLWERETPIQFISRWCFSNPKTCIESFDFTICQAAIWYENSQHPVFGDQTVGKWRSYCSDDFYKDLAANRMTYTWPIREEEAGGSAIRVLKYYKRGYRIPLDSYGQVIARLMAGVEMKRFREEGWNSEWLAKVLTGLLYEVDPNSVNPAHYETEKDIDAFLEEGRQIERVEEDRDEDLEEISQATPNPT